MERNKSKIFEILRSYEESRELFKNDSYHFLLKGTPEFDIYRRGLNELERKFIDKKNIIAVLADNAANHYKHLLFDGIGIYFCSNKFVKLLKDASKAILYSPLMLLEGNFDKIKLVGYDIMSLADSSYWKHVNYLGIMCNDNKLEFFDGLPYVAGFPDTGFYSGESYSNENVNMPKLADCFRTIGQKLYYE